LREAFSPARLAIFLTVLHHAVSSTQPLRASAMDPKSQSEKWRENILSTINVTIDGLNLAKEISSPTPAKAVFGSVSAILTMIRVCLPSSVVAGFRLTFIQDSMMNRDDCVELGSACADVCKALERGLQGKRSDDLSQPVLDAIEELRRWVWPSTRAAGAH
jgi:hypothetical protein